MKEFIQYLTLASAIYFSITLLIRFIGFIAIKEIREENFTLQTILVAIMWSLFMYLSK